MALDELNRLKAGMAHGQGTGGHMNVMGGSRQLHGNGRVVSVLHERTLPAFRSSLMIMLAPCYLITSCWHGR